MMRSFRISIALLVALFMLTWGSGYAMTQFWREIAGSGNLHFTEQVTVVSMAVQGTGVEIGLRSVAATKADYQYKAVLLLDGAGVNTVNVSWRSNEIPNFNKLVKFDNVSLVGVANVSIEVRH